MTHLRELVGSVLLFGLVIFVTPARQQTFVSPMPIIPDCQGGALQYTASTKTLTCGALTGGALPAGFIGLVASGTCPAGTTEVAALTGKTLVGTVAGNGDVGGTGGSDTLTPSGTIAWPAGVPTFSGAALGNHLHGAGTIAVAAHTVVATKQGASAGNVVTTATHSVSGSTANASAGTPAGTVAWPAGVPTLTGAQGDNRSAFTKVIFCRAS